ncbi:ANTAR domain-containing protein [Streptomyces flaveolus]|uniref:ANTAR domain-containing protein n=1 Tax=Streptomyces flaveolus TaxID=67297 RepID=UPI0034129354
MTAADHGAGERVDPGEPEPPREEGERLRAQLRDLRARARVHPLVSQAQRMLRERYALPDAETAFALMQRASQRSNTMVSAHADRPLREPSTRHWTPWAARRAAGSPGTTTGWSWTPWNTSTSSGRAARGSRLRRS